MSSLLEARRLAVGYPDHPVAERVEFSLEAGEALSLLGPNGCGKSTLLRTVLGILPPCGGEVLLQGRALESWPRRELARQMAYVPQSHAGLFAFTCEEIVLMGRSARTPWFSVPSVRDRQVASDCLAQLGIAHLARRNYLAISGGERQLVLLARALAQEAGLLVLDEPTSSLDFGNQLRVEREILSLRGRGIAVLLATHEPDLALLLGGQVLLLEKGRVLASGGVELLSSATLARLYGVDRAEVERRLPHLPQPPGLSPP